MNKLPDLAISKSWGLNSLVFTLRRFCTPFPDTQHCDKPGETGNSSASGSCCMRMKMMRSRVKGRWIRASRPLATRWFMDSAALTPSFAYQHRSTSSNLSLPLSAGMTAIFSLKMITSALSRRKRAHKRRSGPMLSMSGPSQARWWQYSHSAVINPAELWGHFHYESFRGQIIWPWLSGQFESLPPPRVKRLP